MHIKTDNNLKIGNIMATENQKATINDIIEVKMSVYLHVASVKINKKHA